MGRADELERLGGLLEETARGSGGLAIIEGEAGIGKTRLVDWAITRARDAGIDALEGQADELGVRHPYHALIDLLRAADPEGEGVLAPLLHAADVESRMGFAEAPHGAFRAAQALLEMLEAREFDAPILLVVEDLQWADSGTLTVLREASRHLPELPVLLLVSLRPIPRSAELASLIAALQDEHASELELGPLAGEEVVELTQSTVGAEPGPTLRRQVARAGGNPLFVLELLAALQGQGSLEITEERLAETGEIASLSTSIRPTILRRLRQLSVETLDLLGLASVLGSSFRPRHLATMVEKPLGALTAPLREAIQGGLLAGDDQRLAFRHDLIREALYEDVPPAVRAGLHMDAASVLEVAGAPLEAVAEHLLRGAAPGDRESAALLVRAAGSAAPKAPSVAVGLLERTLALIEPDDPTRDSVITDLATNLMWAGRAGEAEALAGGALEVQGQRPAEGALRACRAQALLIQGRTPESLAELARAIDSPTLSTAERIRLRAWHAHAHALAGDFDGAAQMALGSREEARDAGDDYSLCLALNTLGLVEGVRGHAADAVSLSEEAVRLADASPGREAHRFHHNVMLASALLDSDRLHEGLEALQRGTRISEEIGAVWNLPFFHNALTAYRYFLGDWAAAIVDYETGVELAEAVDGRQGLASVHGIRCMIAVHRNDLQTAHEMSGAAGRLLAERGTQFRFHWAAWAHALLLEAEGDQAAACGVLGSAWDGCERAGAVGDLYLFGPDLVRMALAGGDRDRAARAVNALDELEPLLRATAPTTAALRARFLLEGDAEIAVAAVESARSGPRPHDLARACEEAGASLGAAGRLDDARALFDEAIDVYDGLDASRDVARANAAMRALGLRRGARGPRSQSSGGWDALTPAELRVAQLVAEGMTNPEVAERLFISRYTVRTHVSHVLAKLGLRSRVQLAAEVARRRT